KMSYRCRNACATIYECDMETALAKLKEWPSINYAVIGQEVCPDTNRPHLQCYFEFRNSMRQSTFTNKLGLPVYYFKSRYKKATAEECSNYCKKDNNYEEWGKQSMNPGHRSDLEDVLECIKEGMTEREIAENYTDISARYMKWIQRMIELFGR
ncbi:replication protein, partial [uncultured marine virus]